MDKEILSHFSEWETLISCEDTPAGYPVKVATVQVGYVQIERQQCINTSLGEA